MSNRTAPDISFYRQYQLSFQPKQSLKFCKAEICQIQAKYTQKFGTHHSLAHLCDQLVVRIAKVEKEKIMLIKDLTEKQGQISELERTLKENQKYVGQDIKKVTQQMQFNEKNYSIQIQYYNKLLNMERTRNVKLCKKVQKRQRQYNKLERVMMVYRNQLQFVVSQNNYLQQIMRKNPLVPVDFSNLSGDSYSQAERQNKRNARKDQLKRSQNQTSSDEVILIMNQTKKGSPIFQSLNDSLKKGQRKKPSLIDNQIVSTKSSESQEKKTSE